MVIIVVALGQTMQNGHLNRLKNTEYQQFHVVRDSAVQEKRNRSHVYSYIFW